MILVNRDIGSKWNKTGREKQINCRVHRESKKIWNMKLNSESGQAIYASNIYIILILSYIGQEINMHLLNYIHV